MILSNKSSYAPYEAWDTHSSREHNSELSLASLPHDRMVCRTASRCSAGIWCVGLLRPRTVSGLDSAGYARLRMPHYRNRIAIPTPWQEQGLARDGDQRGLCPGSECSFHPSLPARKGRYLSLGRTQGWRLRSVSDSLVRRQARRHPPCPCRKRTAVTYQCYELHNSGREPVFGGERNPLSADPGGTSRIAVDSRHLHPIRRLPRDRRRLLADEEIAAPSGRDYRKSRGNHLEQSE